MKQQAELLMCAPTHYDVNYIINPWMEGNIHAASKLRACEQWKALHAELLTRAQVRLVEPVLGSPDMVFTANAGLKCGNRIALSRFQYAERQAEAALFEAWFEQAGYQVDVMPEGTSFEGEGDALWSTKSTDREVLWAGHGFRTDIESHRLLEQWWGVEVRSLRLTDPRFYHLDTCFAPLPSGDLMYFPAAFDEASQSLIEKHYTPAQRIVVCEADAVNFACNVVCLEEELVLNHISVELHEALQSRAFKVVETPLTEFLKAGGAAKCLVMTLT